MPFSRRARLVALTAILALFSAIAVASLSRFPYPASTIGVDILVGWSLLAAGLVAWDRRPENRIGPLLVLAGVDWFLFDLTRAPSATIAYLAFAFGQWWDPILAIIVLAYPSGRLTGRIAIAVAAGWVLVQSGWTVAKLVLARPYVWSDCPACIDTQEPYTANAVLLGDLARVETLLLAVLTVPTLLVIGARWLRSRGAARRILSPVLASGIFLVLVQAVQFTGVLITGGLWLLPDGSNLLSHLVHAGRIALAFSILYGVLRFRSTQASLPVALVELGPLPSARELETVLRSRLGDPDLRVLRWSNTLDAYVDGDGRTVAGPLSGGDRILVPLEQDGAPIAAVDLDAALDDPGLAATIGSLVRHAVQATDLRDELRAHGGDVAGLPTGEVTFLFGDVEGSTALLEALGERYADLLSELRRLVGEVIDRHGGRVVDARADEVFAVFPSATGAAAAALELGDRMATAAWPEGSTVRMRIGLHTGRPELTGSGYVGLDVHRAARVMAAAHGGQVVATTAVVEALGASEGLTVRPLGRFSLRGLSEPTAIVQLDRAGAPASFPPLRAEPVG